MIAALYVETDGAYSAMGGVDPWDIERDARTYAGPHPVVAHPPCERWGRFWHGSPRKPHQFNLGDDGGCFTAALAAVRQWGGVLEHPADSQAWKAHGLSAPPRSGGWHAADFQGGWTCYVEQGFYGHKARKATWLYACGVELPSLRWGRGEQRLDPLMVERHGYEYARRKGLVSMIGGKRKKQIRNATPPEFRDLLLSIARSAYGLAPAMSRSATLTGPGTSLSPATQRLTVLASTSSALAAATCDKPSAAMAASNSSADNAAVLQQAEAVGGQGGANGRHRVVLGEAVGQRAFTGEQGQPLGAVGADADEANGLGGHRDGGGRGGGALAHDPYVGPLALMVNREYAA